MFRHLCCKLALVEIRVTIPAAKTPELKHQVIRPRFPVTRLARHCDMGAAQRKPSLVVLGERERRWFEAPHGMADRAVA